MPEYSFRMMKFRRRTTRKTAGKIGAVAVLGLAGTAVYLKKRRKAPAITAEKVIEELTDREK